MERLLATKFVNGGLLKIDAIKSVRHRLKTRIFLVLVFGFVEESKIKI